MIPTNEKEAMLVVLDIWKDYKEESLKFYMNLGRLRVDVNLKEHENSLLEMESLVQGVEIRYGCPFPEARGIINEVKNTIIA